MAEAAGMSTERLDAIRSLTRGYVDRGELPMVRTMVSRSGKIVLNDTFGYDSTEAEFPLAEDAIFRLYR